MRYAYFPGCSLEKNAAAYNDSFKAVVGALAQELVELEDWNCCGATEYFSLNPLPAYALVARNLALVGEGLTELVAPCSACYVNLYKTDRNMGLYPQLNQDVNTALAEGKLSYQPGRVRVRHALDILVNDVGCDNIAARVTKPLHGLRLAPYYGCLVVRPDHGFDNPEYPETLDRLLEALGATVVDYPLKAACCGGHMPQIKPETAFTLIHELVATAAQRQADAIVTVCPMCQLNLDGYQAQVNAQFNTSYSLPVLYFTQMMGLAFGFTPKELGFGQELVSAQRVLDKLAAPLAVEEEPKKKPPRDKKALPMPGRR
ncbi:MAG: CoB--CoM heterodisulfide reductase iron-sulfur subunit B family protein [Thermoflexales bacterium]|nr:CoB--CoM heterodisulfide reductase iron-sulfur subunit B family protein [Thermoflexales bacterium]